MNRWYPFLQALRIRQGSRFPRYQPSFSWSCCKPLSCSFCKINQS
jgi:hypothetical protein